MKCNLIKKGLVFICILVSFISCSNTKKIQRETSEAQAKDGSKKNSLAVSFTLSTVTNKPYLGIGLIVDSATGLSRSFAFYDLFKNNLLTNLTDTLYPVMVDYQFTAPYAITGTSTLDHFIINLYKKGKKIKEIIAARNWKDIYLKIQVELEADNNFESFSKFKPVFEGEIENINSKKIKDCLPGYTDLLVPYSKVIDTLKRYIKLKYYYPKDIYSIIKELYGKYSTFNENKLFFFRNTDVPANLKAAARPLVFPLYKSLIPSVTYLSAGKKLAELGDLGGALNCYYSSLITANNILTSPFERAFVRYLTFEQLALTHRQLSGARVYTSQLFQLGADMNRAFLSHPESNNQRFEYYKNINEVEYLFTKAEDEAKKIRGQKRLGGFMALVTYAGSISTVNAYDNTASNELLNESSYYLTTSIEQANQVSSSLNEQYENIENKIDVKSFFSSDGSTKIALGKTCLSGEVYYYLVTNPDAVKNVLLSFAQDKPKLKSLLNDFYSGENKSSLLSDIYLQFTNIENCELGYELRGISVPENILSRF